MSIRSGSRISKWAFGALLLSSSFGAIPARGGNECLAIALSGALGPHIFSDGFESGDLLAWGGPGVPSFVLAATEDLVVDVTLDPVVTGEHLLELRWSLPGGQLYQSVAVPFTVGAAQGAAANAKRTVAGYPFPVPVFAARSAEAGAVAGSSIVSSALPVAGTSIVEAGVTGLWRVEAFLDGSETACGATVDFRLEP